MATATATKTRTTRATKTGPTPKAPVGKKSTAASPAKTSRTTATRATAKKTASAAPAVRTRKSAAPVVETAPVKRGRKTPVAEVVEPVKSTGRRGGNAQALEAKQKGKVKVVRTRVLDETTGFVPGTDSHIIAEELLKGGATRAAIIERLRGKLNAETRNGTPKSIANVVASTYAKMVARGFTVDAHYKLEAPTPASKRAATRRANAKK